MENKLLKFIDLIRSGETKIYFEEQIEDQIIKDLEEIFPAQIIIKKDKDEKEYLNIDFRYIDTEKYQKYIQQIKNLKESFLPIEDILLCENDLRYLGSMTFTKISEYDYVRYRVLSGKEYLKVLKKEIKEFEESLTIKQKQLYLYEIQNKHIEEQTEIRLSELSSKIKTQEITIKFEGELSITDQKWLEQTLSCNIIKDSENLLIIHRFSNDLISKVMTTYKNDNRTSIIIDSSFPLYYSSKKYLEEELKVKIIQEYNEGKLYIAFFPKPDQGKS